MILLIKKYSLKQVSTLFQLQNHMVIIVLLQVKVKEDIIIVYLIFCAL